MEIIEVVYATFGLGLCHCVDMLRLGVLDLIYKGTRGAKIDYTQARLDTRSSFLGQFSDCGRGQRWRL